MIALIQRINPGFLRKHTGLIVLFFAILNFAFFFINRQYGFGFPYLALAGYTTFAMIFGLLVNDAVMRETKIIHVLFNNSILRFFGKISYGFYMFHWPVLILLSPWLYKNLSSFIPLKGLAFTVSFIATLIAILISWISYRYFESYFLKKKRKFA
jgi:peptidoglycan/LPS O-acetylase OafA/YrhL